MYNIKTNKKRKQEVKAGCLFLLLILIGYAAAGGYEQYLDHKLEKLVEPTVVLVEGKDGSSHYETLDGAEFACPRRKLIF